jgi:AbrB family looped-hinge helix DNA binding protein
MTLKIDKAGRVILPKPVRDRLGLRAGSDIEVEETADGVVLKPAHRKPAMVKRGKFLVYCGEIPTGYDIVRAIDDEREDRMRLVWALAYSPGARVALGTISRPLSAART